MTSDPGIEVVGENDLDERASALGPATGRIFETDDALLVRFRLERGGTDWHTHGDRDAYGVVLTGNARLEYGSADADGVDVAGGEFFHVPSGLVHRAVNTSGDNEPRAVVGIVALAGPGEPVVAVDAHGDGGHTSTAGRNPRVAGPEELVATASLANLTRMTPFPDADVQQVRGHADGRIESEWHHHGDNHVFGYVIEGEGYVEWGTGEGERKLASAGQFFHVPPGVVHRDVNPSDDEQDYLLWLTGSEPRTIHVDEPPAGGT